MSDNALISTAVQRLVDIEAIKALKAKYCWYCDDPEMYSRFPGLFTEDAVFIEEPLDYLEGRPAIEEWNEQYPEFCVWSRHYATTPLIEVNVEAGTGTGRWQALLISVQRVKGEEVMLWAAGVYVEEYAKIDGDWFFARIHASGKWMTSFETGFSDELGIEL